MCGPVGSLFFLGLSIFAVLFLTLLAILIGNEYPYAGEWFDAKGEPGEEPVPLEQQREAAVHNLWMAVIVYGAIGVISAVMVLVNKVRGAL